jgi:chromosome segregation ATPase
LKGQASEAAKGREALQKAHDAAATELKEARQRIEKHLADLKLRESEFAAARGQLEAAKLEKEEAVKTGEARLVDLHGKATRRIAALENEKASMRADVQRIQREAGELRRQTDAAEKALRAKLEKASKAAPTTHDKLRAIEAERDQALAASFAKAKSELAAMSEELRQVRMERDAAKSDPGPVEQAAEQAPKNGEPGPEAAGDGLERLRAVEAERDALRQEVEAIKAGLDRAKQHVASMQTRRDQMRDEIARLKAALGHAPDAMS